MICHYCNGTDKIINYNITHKYVHSKPGCNCSFKLCPTCNTLIVDKQVKSKINTPIITTDSIFDTIICPNCNNSWLPDFPTSWCRSLTNLNKVYEVINDMYNNANCVISAYTLLNIQRSHFGVIFNNDRAKKRGYQEYIAGAPRRRMSEYITQLKYMGILTLNDSDGLPTIELSPLGEELATNKNPFNNLIYYIIAYSNIKINNGHCKPSNRSCYKYFKIRFMENILSSINFIKNTTGCASSKYQIAVSCLCRNNAEFNTYALKYLNQYSSSTLKQLFFVHENELNRAIVSTFLNIFVSLNLLDKDSDNLYNITPLGESVLNFLNHRPAIWYEDIEVFANKNNTTCEDIFAKLMLWRLIKNNLLNESTLRNISYDELNSLACSITNKNLTEFDDIHLNLFFDEPVHKNLDITNSIISLMRNYLDSSEITFDDLCAISKLLTMSWFNSLQKIAKPYEEVSVKSIIRSAEKSFKASLQSGKLWHNKSRKLLNKSGLYTIDYKDNPCFSNLDIPKLKLMLPGGTNYNPDMLIEESLIGETKHILVDAKDSHSIAAEVPKLMGYNLYSKNPNVNSFTIITLRGSLPSTVLDNILSAKNEFDRITIIEESALEELSAYNLDKENLLNFLLPLDGFKHITLNKVKNIKTLCNV